MQSINILITLLFITNCNGQIAKDNPEMVVVVSDTNTTSNITEQKKNVKTRTNWRTKYDSNGQMNAEPLKGMVDEYDSFGHLIKSRQYTDDGKPYKREWFEYAKSGKMIKATVSYMHDNFIETELLLKYNEEDRVIEMKVSKPMESYWYKETLAYNKNGEVSEKKWWTDEENLFGSVNRAEYFYENGLLFQEIGYTTEGIFVTVKYFYDANKQLKESHYYGYGKVQDLYMISKYEYEYS